MQCNNCKNETAFFKLEIRTFNLSLCETCIKEYLTKYYFIFNLLKMKMSKEDKQKFDLFLKEFTD